jgi:DNA-binding NtrC family response regulator
MRILIVDDDKDQVKALSLSLRSNGYETATAESADRALTILERQREWVDLVIADFAMPGMNGLQLLRKIKKKYPSLPVVIMSAKGTDGLAQNTVQSGGEMFLNKPFLIEELLQGIHKIAGQKGKSEKSGADQTF